MHSGAVPGQSALAREFLRVEGAFHLNAGYCRAIRLDVQTDMNRMWLVDDLTSALNVEESGGTVTREIAGVGARFVAGLIDCFIKLVLQAAAVFLFVQLYPGPATAWQLSALVAGLLFGSFVYSAGFEHFARGQTPGKNACGLRVVTFSGGRPSFARILIRNLARIVDWLPVNYLAGGARALATRGCQRWGDQAAGTLVVYDESLKEMVARAGVTESVYSTSEDGYLLESFVLRSDSMREAAIEPLANRLAAYLHGKYPPSQQRLANEFENGNHLAFLRLLYLEEKDAHLAHAANEPS